MADLDTTTADIAQEQADFGSGFTGSPVEKPAEKPEAKPEPAATPPVAEKPEYVQVTKKEWDEIKAAAMKTASYDQQFSRAFGTLGNLQKNFNELRNAPPPVVEKPPPTRAEILKEAFAEMEKDFPELAQQNRAALERALSGVPGANGAELDVDKIRQMMVTHTTEREIEALEDAYPEWRTIVGAVDINKEQPDPDNPFRKWLVTKDATYQARVNGSESAAVISRAIRLFQNETKAPPKPVTKPRDEARAERIREAVQPRGDGAGASPGKTEQDDFLAGFNSR